MSGAHTPGPWRDGCDATGAPIVFQRVTRYTLADDVNPERVANLKLLDAAPDLLTMAHRYASECGECAGTRICPDDSPCTECADIWRVIDKAEGRS